MNLALLIIAGVTLLFVIDVWRIERRTARQVRRIRQHTEQIIMEEKDLQAALDGIKTSVTAVADRLALQTTTIADLQAQVAAGTPVSQEQLDALVTEANEISAVLAPLATA